MLRKACQFSDPEMGKLFEQLAGKRKPEYQKDEEQREGPAELLGDPGPGLHFPSRLGLSHTAFFAAGGSFRSSDWRRPMSIGLGNCASKPDSRARWWSAS